MAKQKQQKRTYARNRTKSSELFSRKGKERIQETDSVFFLKLVVFVLLSAIWLKFDNPLTFGNFAIQAFPAGLLVALLLVVKIEKYQFNRKIWYVALILTAVVTSLSPAAFMI